MADGAPGISEDELLSTQRRAMAAVLDLDSLLQRLKAGIGFATGAIGTASIADGAITIMRTASGAPATALERAIAGRR